jgi:hypothetical protein
MNLNFTAFAALVLSLVAFGWVHARLRPRPMSVRLGWLAVLAVMAVPGVLFGLYYVHVLREWEWFYTLRSWRGSELLMVFPGCAGGALASCLSRPLLVFPLLLSAALAAAPSVKSLINPLEQADVRNRWEGNVCLQSTGSTCGPASVCTILKKLGTASSERAVAQAAYTTLSGTEAWYLARYVRSQGYVPTFRFLDTFTPSAGLPALVGVLQADNGHFIAVLDLQGDQLTIADPMRGEEHLSLAEFRQRYHCTGFHMIVARN